MPYTLDSIFGSPVAKMLDYLIDQFAENPHIDHSKNEVQAGTKLAEKTMLTHFPKLHEQNLIQKTRDIGKTEMFMLSDQPTVSHLIELKNQLKMMNNGNSNETDEVD